MSKTSDLFELILTKLNTLDKTIDTTMTRAFIRGTESKKKNKENIYRDVEDLLRAKETLIENILDYQKELSQLNLGFNTSASIMPNLSQDDISYNEILERKKLILEEKIERDTAILGQINRGLNSIKDERYNKIIQLKYMQGRDVRAIANILKIPEATVISENKRLIKKIAVKIYSGEVL